MNQELLNYRSIRAQKARLGVLLGKKSVRMSLMGMVAAFFVLGAAIVVSTLQPAGVIVASFAVWPLMLLMWHKYELEDLRPLKESQPTMQGQLSGDVLGRLKAGPTPQQIAEAVMNLNGGLFFVTRFGIGPNFLTELSSHLPDETEVIWRRALELRDKYQADTVDAAILLTALVEQIPGSDQLLARLQLSPDDIDAGLGWYQHIRHIVENHKVKKQTGGIGRDWAFGYTPMLSRFALNVSESVAGGLLTRDLEGHQEVIGQVTKLLSGGGRQNAVLVGQTGVGKTTLVYAFAERLINPSSVLPQNLRYRQVMALDPASLIAQARGRGELENLVQGLFVEALKAKNVVIFLDDAQLFLQDGTGSVDLSNLLLPILEGGGLRIILAMDEQRWLQLSQTNPALTQYMNRITVSPLGKDDTMLVLQDQLLILEFRNHVTYMYQSLEEAFRLGSRYVQDRAMPGQAISLLEAAVQTTTDGLVTTTSIQQAVEKTYGVRVGNANAADERTKLLNLEQLIHERMINQVRAVNVVSNALRRARAGVRNQDRPIGTFLFLGPTGVGKTELSKALAAVYFGGEDRLVRLDLNEFSRPEDVSRLIADGAHDPNGLAAQIAKQPFSVVLLDEIEKAHPNVLNTLLQLLDEGVMRDINNRAVSFRDAIVIATSNAGADRIRQYIDSGWQLEQFEEKFVNELIDSGQFKPEFLNRFDEIVVFRPLNQAELLQVLGLIVAGINKTLALQKVTVTVADDAKKMLVSAGYDPRLGARPMRRIVQRSIEDIVAKRMLSGEVAPGTAMDITLADVQAALGQNGEPAPTTAPPKTEV
jgi:ATP-dependent Clp protease ATP-binding subunit ClpC